MELQQSLPSLVDHLSDATAIKTKLEQEAIRYAAQLAEQVVQLSKVCTNIEIFRTKLDQITQQRRFCLASNEFYNELERLERLERELSAAKPVGATQFGYVNQKERNKQLQVEKLKDNQLHMYKNSCILARKLQHERNGIWEHLEVLITTRESEKIEVKRNDKFRFRIDFDTKTCQLFWNNRDLGIIWNKIHTHLVPVVSNVMWGVESVEAEYSLKWV